MRSLPLRQRLANTFAMGDFDAQLHDCADDVERALAVLLSAAELSQPGAPPARLIAAMRHGSLDGGKIKHPQHMEVVFVESKRSLSRSARCPTYMPDSSSTPLKTHTAFRPGRNH